MPVLQFKGKTAIECYHHTLPHHTLEFDGKLLRSKWCLSPQSYVVKLIIDRPDPEFCKVEHGRHNIHKK